ncbi:cyclophilin-like fold protein [Burkholderia multivorans]|nr:cyclophilin-like fold protein [Burkholderia multivorans]
MNRLAAAIALSMALFAIDALTAVLACAAADGTTGASSLQILARHEEHAMRINMDVEGTTITATLENSEAARDFASLLPLTLTLEDYASTEKISDLPRRLSTAGAPSGIAPKVGDLTYYSPWGNLAVFHRDFRYSDGLVKLGTLDAGIEIMRKPGTLKVTVSKVAQ